MKSYIVIYSHTYGHDLYRVTSDIPLFLQYMSYDEDFQQRMADHLGINYEPQNCEFIDAYEEGTITDIPEPFSA